MNATQDYPAVTVARNAGVILSLMCLAIPLASGLSGCKKAEAPAPSPPEVEVVAVEKRDVPIYRDWVGTLEGDVNATISAQVSGYLISRDYREGSIVTNGQVLFRIEPGPFAAALAKARAQLEEAQARRGKTALDVQRYTPLAATEAISRQELDDAIQADKAAAAQVASAEAAMQEAELNLGFTTIRSPVDGAAGLASSAAQIGNLVGPSTGPLTTVSRINPMRVYFSVSQQLLTEIQERRLAEGQQLRQEGDSRMLELVLSSGNVYPHKGRTRFGDNQVDVKTGTVRVVGEFENSQLLLVPGMFARVRVLVSTEKDALLVPQRAVTDMQGRHLIAVVDAENKVSIRPVKAGERVGPEWLISGKVQAGDRVVAEGIQKVREGAVVKPIPFANKTPGATPAAKADKN